MIQDDISVGLRIDPKQGDLVLLLGSKIFQAIVVRFRRFLASDTVPNTQGYSIISLFGDKRRLYSIEVYNATVLYHNSVGILPPYTVRGFYADYAYAGETIVRSILKSNRELRHHTGTLDTTVPEITWIEQDPLD